MKKIAYDFIENFENWFFWNRARKNIIMDTIFPPFCIIRMIDKIFNLKRVEKEKKSIFNELLYNIFNFEKYLLRKINLPFGSSLIVLARYNKDNIL